ncbi:MULTISPECIES: hypothetical protein [Acinetobacter]|uniref:Transmembrane protein n=1 Tax=Acinetobacter genomosp. 15BJ TaxID=106651 RepID=R9BBV5_9GAMM|nr:MULTISPECIES: hypothetical protein [Acinetobacter]EOR09851.1 hypothetical protein F896_00880 [Acinetobacter genomosp. 15BJ]MCH7292120.1 hypothetical protein [Acinetobacter genomosp. 15BJ]MCI3880889.1 hypothetical protein [Acinetobacter higginsii]
MFGYLNELTPKHIKVPFQVIRNYKRESFIWVICVIFLGQIGIFLNYFLQIFFKSKSLIDGLVINFLLALKSDFINGNFYIFSISLMASSLCALVVSFLYDEKSRFKSLKFFTMLFLGSGIAICALVHALIQLNTDDSVNLFIPIYIFQVLGYFIAIFVSIYAACLLRLDFKNSIHKELDDLYHKKSDDKAKIMMESAEQAQVGPDGERF